MLQQRMGSYESVACVPTTQVEDILIWQLADGMQKLGDAVPHTNLVFFA